MDDKERFLFYNLLTNEEKELLKIKNYKKGDTLTYFEKMHKFYFILDGEVRLFKNLDKMLLVSVSVLSEGYLVGILRFLTEVGITDETIVLTDTLKVIEIDLDIIKRLKNESFEFNNYLIDLILKRGLETIESLRIKTFSGIKGLIAYNLIKHSRGDYLYIERYDEIIKYLNISHNGFYSTLNKLVKDKLIEKSKNSIKILDAQKLKGLYSDFLN
ncbi:Crp/Fnr family transcriptional regulator [Psychrilyobacter atlanticus]|uniref:Crp/Fnr family transcriptional regulator n=1 Tax=Psychrilyobacter atlanticus TaxID=271091 RepID=UPI0004193997|nr:Crp/Fnr family transcriptional regulator [Psychrilyobacter atlanticus]